MDNPKTAMIFAAGFGTRMRPITNNIPKAMVEVCGKKLIDYKIEKFVEVGVEKIVVNTHYLAPIIHEHLKKVTNVEIIISHEKEILGTGGGLINALPHLEDGPIFISNCDTIWIDNNKKENALLRLLGLWNSKTMKIAMLLHPVDEAIGYDGDGDFNIDNKNLISWPPPPRKYVYTGVQICDLNIIKNRQVIDFSLGEIWSELIKNKDDTKNIYGIIHSGQWLHVDSVANLQKAESFIKKNNNIVQ